MGAALEDFGGDHASGEDELLALSDDPLIRTVMQWETIRDEIAKNPLAQFIVQRVMEEALEAINDLLDVDPSDVAKVTVIQERLRFHRKLGWWLRSVKDEADQARRLFDDGQAQREGGDGTI